MSKKKVLVGDEVPNQQSLREELMGRFSRESMGLKNREISVMTRMSPYIVEVIDALVELEVFKSRSEVVSTFMEQMIMDRKPLFDEIRNQAQDISVKRESAKRLAFQAMKTDKE
jgi:Arc/MetJ-type ribon-helix-helix transcriptional regulator